MNICMKAAASSFRGVIQPSHQYPAGPQHYGGGRETLACWINSSSEARSVCLNLAGHLTGHLYSPAEQSVFHAGWAVRLSRFYASEPVF